MPSTKHRSRAGKGGKVGRKHPDKVRGESMRQEVKRLRSENRDLRKAYQDALSNLARINDQKFSARAVLWRLLEQHPAELLGLMWDGNVRGRGFDDGGSK